MVALILAPLLYSIVWTFWGTDVVGVLRPASHPTVHWLGLVVTDSEWRAALWYSTLIAAVSATLGASIIASFSYINRFSPRWVDRWTFVAMMFVLLNPALAYGMSVRYMGSRLAAPEWPLLVASHLILVLPLQYLVFETNRELIPTTRLWGARTLGASHPTAFKNVFLPSARSAFLAALLLGFFASFDEVVVAITVIQSTAVTAPLKLWQALSYTVTPVPAVVSLLLLIAASAGLLLQKLPEHQVTARWIRRKTEALELYWIELSAIGLSALFAWWLLDNKLNGVAARWIEGSLTAVFSITIGFIVGLYRIRAPVRELLRARIGDVRGTDGVTVDFFHRAISIEANQMRSLRGGGWVELTAEELHAFSDACFDRCEGGRYIGTDQHVPSRFLELYRNYVRRQVQREGVEDDLRIVLYGETELSADFSKHPELGRQFIRHHSEAGFRTLSVERAIAEEAAARFALPSLDFGIFAGRYIVFFKAPETGIGPFSVMLRSLNDEGLAVAIDSFLEVLAYDSSELLQHFGAPSIRKLDLPERQQMRAAVARPAWSGKRRKV